MTFVGTVLYRTVTADGRERRPPNLRTVALVAERRTVVAAAHVTRVAEAAEAGP